MVCAVSKQRSFWLLPALLTAYTKSCAVAIQGAKEAWACSRSVVDDDNLLAEGC
jgi:hypothetical protein